MDDVCVNRNLVSDRPLGTWLEDRNKPMVTREEYDRARAVLDALPPGLYMKCSECDQWWRDTTISFQGRAVLCERCV